MRLAHDIARASRSFSRHIVQMQSDLTLFVSDLEKMDVKNLEAVNREAHLGFNALTNIFTLGPLIIPFLHSDAPGSDLGMITPAMTAFCKEAFEIWRMAAGMSLVIETRLRSVRRNK